jgi:hypothetical protein
MLQADPTPEQDAAAQPATSDANRRRDKRHMTVFQVAKLITARSQELCLIRNISAGGLMAEVYLLLAVGEPISVEFKAGEKVSGKVVWVKDRSIGMQFDTETAVLDILAHKAALESGFQPRAPRLETPVQARLKLGDTIHHVPIRDISQGGIKVQIADMLPINADIVVTVGELGQRRGVVRWCSDGCAGISFIPSIPYQEMAQWRARGGN